MIATKEPRPSLNVLLRSDTGETRKFFFDTYEYNQARERHDQFGRVEVLNWHMSNAVGHLSTAIESVDPKNGKVDYKTAYMALYSAELTFVVLAMEYKFFHEDDGRAITLARNIIFDSIAKELGKATAIAYKGMRSPGSDRLTQALLESGFAEQVRELYDISMQHLISAHNEELAQATRIPRP